MEKNSDRMFAPTEFNKLQVTIGRKFTLDGASNQTGDNSHVPDNFCYANGRAFEDEDLVGQHVFLNAPFEHLEVMLQHYCSEKSRSPHNTSGCSKWQGATFFKYLKGMQLVAHYAKGTRIFHAINTKSGKRELMPGIPWEVLVYYDPPQRVRPSKRVRFNAADVEEPHTLSMEVKGALAGRKCSFFLDTMAKVSFINASLVRRVGLTVAPGAQYRVVAYDGRDNPSLGTTTCRLKLGGLRDDVTLHVLEMDEDLDVILGEDWLHSHKVEINYDQCVITAKSAGTKFVLPSTSVADPAPRCADDPDAPPVFLRSAQVKRFIRKRVDMFVVNVRPVAEVGERDDRSPDGDDKWRGFPSDSQTPTLSGSCVVDEAAMARVLRDNADVLADLPPGLPPQRATEHTIPLIPGSRPVFRPPYRLSPTER